MRVELYHFTVLGLDPRQRTNEVPMSDNRRGVNTLPFQEFHKTIRALLQDIMRLNRDPSVVLFAIVPPTVI